MAKTDYETDATKEANREHVFDRSRVIEVERPAGGPKSTLAIRFDGTDIERLRGIAEATGIGITQLVRSWVLERLDAGAPDTEDRLLEDLTATLEKSLDTARKVKAVHLSSSIAAH